MEPIELRWGGPYAWPGFEAGHHLPPTPTLPGVYLQTFAYEGGYLIYAAGLTRRPVRTRLREHTRRYMNGEYDVLDVGAATRGIRHEVWHGSAYAREHRAEFELRRLDIRDAVRRQLAGLRIFVADPGSTEPRVRERLEAAIMASLYRQPPPICDLPDRGMYLAPRRSSEPPIVMRNECASRLHGLPTFLKA